MNIEQEAKRFKVLFDKINSDLQQDIDKGEPDPEEIVPLTDTEFYIDQIHNLYESSETTVTDDFIAQVAKRMAELSI